MAINVNYQNKFFITSWKLCLALETGAEMLWTYKLTIHSFAHHFWVASALFFCCFWQMWARIVGLYIKCVTKINARITRKSSWDQRSVLAELFRRYLTCLMFLELGDYFKVVQLIFTRNVLVILASGDLVDHLTSKSRLNIFVCFLWN